MFCLHLGSSHFHGPLLSKLELLNLFASSFFILLLSSDFLLDLSLPFFFLLLLFGFSNGLMLLF